MDEMIGLDGIASGVEVKSLSSVGEEASGLSVERRSVAGHQDGHTSNSDEVVIVVGQCNHSQRHRHQQRNAEEDQRGQLHEAESNEEGQSPAEVAVDNLD